MPGSERDHASSLGRGTGALARARVREASRLSGVVALDASAGTGVRLFGQTEGAPIRLPKATALPGTYRLECEGAIRVRARNRARRWPIQVNELQIRAERKEAAG